ncbi:hypothetical protein [Achromobacter piechaudii]|uniref:Uncharacterized protein n=1 Tax=Achromobacter piechaudii TaxID=72556 RepID=A0A6S7D2Y4_9BURK|nr:hypothetical protein [Achromobacter piechaudii]CAB3864227.1 hypothetical protein LMG1861_02422 [Achromobacter piechaudii]
MSTLAEIQRVGRTLADCFGAFSRQEQVLREELSRAQVGTSPQASDLLERRTRRFLVDGILRAFGWDADDAAAVREEARSSSATGEPLYFDYLGFASAIRTPVLIVEAKGADIDAPRPRNGAALSSLETAKLLVNEIAILKGSTSSSRVTAEWRGYLRDLRTYVQSLDSAGRATLRRVVITTGKWLVVFDDPIATFVADGLPDANSIYFFSSMEDIQAEVEQIYLLLHRRCLVDDIPLTTPVADALRWMRSDHVDGYLRALLVATTKSGARRRSYPTRSIYPALAIETEGRVFVVVDYDTPPVEEKMDVDDINYLLQAIQVKGTALESRMRSVIGAAATPKSLVAFAGLTISTADTLMRERVTVEAGSSAARAGIDPQWKRLVDVTGEAGADSEFVIITGEAWFYKLNEPLGPDCTYHLWRTAKDGGVTSDLTPISYTPESFTQDAQVRHCAHGDHRAVRDRRCQLDGIETHLCCRACVFEQVCWRNDRSPLPCPTIQLSTTAVEGPAEL